MDYIGRYFLQAAKDFMGYEVGFFRICQKKCGGLNLFQNSGPSLVPELFEGNKEKKFSRQYIQNPNDGPVSKDLQLHTYRRAILYVYTAGQKIKTSPGKKIK